MFWKRATETRGRPLVRRESRHVPALEPHQPGGRAVDPRQHVERRRLPRAVGADQRVNATALDCEIDPVDRLEAAEMLREPLDLESRRGPGSCLRQAERRGPTCAGHRSSAGFQVLAHESPDPDRHEGHDQDDREAVDREIEPRDLLQEPEPFGQQDEERGPDHGTDGRADAAEQRHGEKDDRFREGELIRAHIGEASREEPAAEARQKRADGEGQHLGAVHVDAHDPCRELVVPDGPHGAPEPRFGHPPDEIADPGQHDEAQRQIALPVGEERRPDDARHAVGTARHRDPIDQHEREDLLEADRHHGEVMATEPQRRGTQDPAEDQRDREAAHEAQPEV